MPELGCGKSLAFVYDQGGERQIGQLTGKVTKVEYGRVLDDFSTATITLAGPIDADCCGLVAKLEPWRHEIVVFRDGKRVWEGPIRNISMEEGLVVIDAGDVLTWTDRQIHGGIADTLEQSPTFIWLTDFSRAFDGNDPNVTPYLRLPFQVSGPAINHEVQPNSSYYGDDMKTLADQGVNFTTNGRSTIVWPERFLLGRTNPLITGRHYLGKVKFIVSGDDYVSEAMARDQNGVTVTKIAPTRAYYGRVQKLVDGNGALGAAAMDYLAQLEIDRHGRQMPVVVVPPQAAALSPKAPVTFEDLVCGMVVPLSVTDPLCRKFSADMILTSVDVIDDASGETVSIGLTMLGADGANGPTKPWTLKSRLRLQEQVNRRFDYYRRTHP